MEVQVIAVTYEQIRCFITLAQTLNYTVAAEELFIAQPTLSRAIISLESELQLRLFTRNRHKVAVTSSGQKLLPLAKKLIQDYCDMQKTGRMLAQGFSSTLNIGLSESDCFARMSRSIQTFEHLYPQIKLNFFVGTHRENIQKLKREELDLCFACFSKPPEIEGVTAERIISVSLLATTSCSHPLSKTHGPIFPSSLKGYKILIPDMSIRHYPQLKALNSEDIEYIPSHTWILELVKSGHGVGILLSDPDYPLGRSEGIFVWEICSTSPGSHYVLSKSDNTKDSLKKFVEVILTQHHS